MALFGPFDAMTQRAFHEQRAGEANALEYLAQQLDNSHPDEASLKALEHKFLDKTDGDLLASVERMHRLLSKNFPLDPSNLERSLKEQEQELQRRERAKRSKAWLEQATSNSIAQRQQDQQQTDSPTDNQTTGMKRPAAEVDTQLLPKRTKTRGAAMLGLAEQQGFKTKSPPVTFSRAPIARPQPQASGRRSVERRSALKDNICQSQKEHVSLLSDDDEDATDGAHAAADMQHTGPTRSAAARTAGEAGPCGRHPSTRSTRFMTTSQRFEGLQALFPKEGGVGAVEVTAHDLSRLDPDEFLNDTIIDFYIRYLQSNLEPVAAENFYFFNTFFFKKLTEKSLSHSLPGTSTATTAATNHARVKKWTKGVDIFSKQFLFVPIHDHLHWSLLVVCHPGEMPDLGGPKHPCMLLLDSMNGGGHRMNPVSKAMRDYLAEEWKHKVAKGGDSVPARWAKGCSDPSDLGGRFGSGSMPAKRWNFLPRQDNHCDCGLFLLAYMEFFIFSPPLLGMHYKDIATSKSAQEYDGLFEYPGFMSKWWFEAANASALRYYIRFLLHQLMDEQSSLPESHPSNLALKEAIRDFYSSSNRRYMTPRDYLQPATEAAVKRKADRERQAQLAALKKQGGTATPGAKRKARAALPLFAGGSPETEHRRQEHMVKPLDGALADTGGLQSKQEDAFDVVLECQRSEEDIHDMHAADSPQVLPDSPITQSGPSACC